MKSRACVLAALAATLFGARVHAESLYVIDELIVGVSSTADESGERIGSIRSGDRVEVLDRHDAYARVRLSSGAQGWVKSAYLSAAAPPQRQERAQILELERLKSEVAKLQDEVSSARAAAPLARAPAADPSAATAAERASPGRPSWQWALGCWLLALLAGFVLGWRMLDRRIRRKYGGLRIY
jgi:hypothetical protein